MAEIPNLTAIQAQAQAWVIGMLGALNDVYELGVVLGKGTTIQNNGQTLYPDVIFLPNDLADGLGVDAVHGPAALGVDLIPAGMPEPPRQELRKNYAAAGIVEYWQIEADTGKAFVYQLGANGVYELAKPDRKGWHYSLAAEELFFPAVWFKDQPGLMEMLEFWELISG
ncbi:MAG TPA: Uma2 family endonuclease [Thermoflexales bacterium]|nr:Uma2 family endonuclease [Thermoflexales bacterium]HQW36294.1 Uma2 family endonuclease [Thermoflexales bacterium]HQZ22870.1 Uma2 family endonuclease [Thermoflexales bacterium]HRA00297.1 Uma2 family endonuclease [Thermoflexales bacterium]